MQYTLFWKTGDSNVISGEDFETAVAKAGYGGGAFRALDFWANDDVSKHYVYRSLTRSWEKAELSIDCIKAVKDLYVNPLPHPQHIRNAFVSERKVREVLKENGGFYRKEDYFTTNFNPASSDTQYVLPKYLIEHLYSYDPEESERILEALRETYEYVNAGMFFITKVTKFGDPRQLLKEWLREDFFIFTQFKDGAIDWKLWQRSVADKFLPEYQEKFKKVLVKKREYTRK